MRIQRSPADADDWTDICTDDAAPYTCSLNTTTLANDDFDLRAIATDVAGQRDDERRSPTSTSTTSRRR